MQRPTFHSLAPVLGALLAACGNADETQVALVAPPAAAGADADDLQAAPGEEASPAVLVMTRVCSPEGCNHYMYALAELPADGELDRSRGIELGDTQAAVFEGRPYVFDRFNLSITRWSVDAALTVRAERTVSLQNTGVSQLDAIGNVFVSPTRAFLLDSKAGVLVTWNPSSMEVVAVTDVPGDIFIRAGAPLYGLWPVAAGGRVYFAASWYDYDSRRGYEKAALLSFSSADDRPNLEVIEDDRCGITSSIAPFAGEAGEVYFAGDWYIGLNQIGVNTGRATKPACLLRLDAATGAVDPDYYVDLLQAADARAVTAAFYLGSGRWLMNVWPNSAPPLSEAEIAADPEAYLAASSFEYVVIADLVAGTRVPVVGLDRGTYGGLTPMYMDGSPYVQIFSGGLNTGATLYQVKSSGEARRVLSAGPNGDFELVGRLR